MLRSIRGRVASIHAAYRFYKNVSTDLNPLSHLVSSRRPALLPAGPTLILETFEIRC